LLERSWWATSPTGKVLTCGLYRGAVGRVEVRATYPRENLIRSELVRDIDAGRTLASQWKAIAIGAGFVDVVESAAGG
jgi:hypothetical protein